MSFPAGSALLAGGTAILLGGTLFAVGSAPKNHTIGAYVTSLDGRARNQRHNALLALKRLDGAVIQPGEVFSFNARVGSFNRDEGYRRAPVSGTLGGNEDCRTASPPVRPFVCATREGRRSCLLGYRSQVSESLSVSSDRYR